MSFGIDNLKMLISLPTELGNVADAISGDTGDWKKYFKLVDILDEVIDIVRVDWSVVKEEFDDLTEEEVAELKVYVQNKFDIRDDKLETIIEESLEILLSMGELINKAIKLVKTSQLK